MTKSKNAWAYNIRAHTSILQDYPNKTNLDNYSMSILFDFYVLHCPCKSTSFQSKPFSSYGWKGSIRTNGLGKALDAAIPNGSGPFCLPKTYAGAGLDKSFGYTNLMDGQLADTSMMRAAIAGTTDSNSYLRLFRHIRNCLAHGRFIAIDDAQSHKTNLIMEDKDNLNYTARMVLSLDTVIKWTSIVTQGPQGIASI